MKTFIQHQWPSLKRIDGDEGRKYMTPTGQSYPSVTSVLGLYKQQAIQEWKNRVGEDQARVISSRASKRGTAIHSLCEQYLLGQQPTPGMFDHEMFHSLVPILDKIDNIHCLETQLYSHHLEVAGTVDCIAEYEGKLHIIDFKTSKKIKPKEYIEDYFMQTSAYAVMFEELTGIPVNRMLVIIGVDNHEPQIFKEKRDSWIGQFKQLRKQYKEIKYK